MRSTMQDVPLSITSILLHGTTVHHDSEVVTATADGTRSQTYAALGERAARLANALRALGIDGDQRVATFMWNNAEHLEAYLAIPSMGAVLHTLNIRLFPEQLTYIAEHHAFDVSLVRAAQRTGDAGSIRPGHRRGTKNRAHPDRSDGGRRRC